MAGRLEKLTNAAFEEGVVGQRCAEYEQPPAPPAPPEPPPVPPGSPNPPGGSQPPNPCAGAPMVYFKMENSMGMMECYRQRLQDGPCAVVSRPVKVPC